MSGLVRAWLCRHGKARSGPVRRGVAGQATEIKREREIMGGGKVKRRHLEAWVWRNTWTGDVSLSTREPVWAGERWCRSGSVIVCPHILKRLIGRTLAIGADPIRVRIPPWTVLAS